MITDTVRSGRSETFPKIEQMNTFNKWWKS